MQSSVPTTPEVRLHARFGAHSPQVRRMQISALNRLARRDRQEDRDDNYVDVDDTLLLPYPQTFGLSDRLWNESLMRVHQGTSAYGFAASMMPMVGLHMLGPIHGVPSSS